MKVKHLELSIAEEFAVLSLLGKDLAKSKKVKIGNSKIYSIAAIFIELFLEDKVILNENKQVVIKDSNPTGIEYKDTMLQILSSKKVIDFKSWMQYFYSHSKIRNSIYDSIIKSIEEKKDIQSLSDTSAMGKAKKQYVDIYNTGDLIIQRIRAELLEEGAIDEKTMYLSLILDSNKLLMSYFSEYEYKAIKNKMNQLYENKATEKFKIIKKSISDIEVFSFVTLVVDILTGLV
ncbi:GPP34 family phosphoprotein [Clostridium sp. YIM B02505]|uniref:GPP34 family phosphoprotein n=1 Tax=Clostridium yunnanense TaxID=2800325 RepID=A0ABS1EWR2_9CLOT|nr:GPP34 family phosphoprotein [Clostridium yunnanense]MBK1813738.1 GPP34 family phosphoprotein [Clostridium yunnanense]